MPNYCLLLQPSHNRLYTAHGSQMALSELAALNAAYNGVLTDLSPAALDTAPCVTFTCTDITPLQPLLARLSASFLLFEQVSETYKPMPLGGKTALEEDLVSIPKYSGKTNERFTRLLINTALLASNFHALPPAQVAILDPLCGRGTTMFEGALHGHPTAGIETDKKEVDWGADYFKKYLKTKRWKHKRTDENIADQHGAFARRIAFDFAPDKDSYKQPLTMDWVRGDTRQAPRLFKKRLFQLLVADLPYGVQHGAAADTGSFTRNPLQLLDQSLPGWRELLAPGGAIALSWNTHVMKRLQLEETLQRHGFSVQPVPGAGFVHRVDQAILRDLIVARKQ